MYDSYAFPVVIIAYCRNSEENGNWCKTHEEIDTWLAKHVSYLISQETRVQTQIWGDTEEIVNDHPYYGDKSNYYPTIKQFKELQFETIKVNPAYKEDEIMGDEFWFSINKIVIDDSNFINTKR
jgi:hypothetical protein